MNPELSIVIATKDRAGYVQRVLQSLVAQQGAPPFEVIVVDNASRDATAAIVGAAIAQVPFRLRCVQEPIPNRGKARNRGVAAAIGATILFVDDDVWLPAGFVAAHARAQARRRGIVSGPILNVASYEARPKPSALNYSAAFLCTCNVSLPAAEFEAVAGFDEAFELYGWEDTELGLRLRARGLAWSFAWDAFLYHIKPPAETTLEVLLAKTIEKARMAARFVRKHPGRRARLAAGAFRLNYLKTRALAPHWILPLYAGVLARNLLPAPAAALLRSRLLDGVYVRELTQALADEPHPAR